MAAQFSNDESTWGRFGNQMHLYYPSVYQDMAGTKRDISGGREFSYVSATEYTMQVFDRINDSRFWKSSLRAMAQMILMELQYGQQKILLAEKHPQEPKKMANALKQAMSEFDIL